MLYPLTSIIYYCIFHLITITNSIILISFRIITLLSFLYFGAYFKTNGQEASFWGARNEALANASVALNDSWALFYNPSGLVFNQSKVLAAYQNKYTSLGIHDGAFGFAFPINKTALGIGVSYFGDNLLNKSKIIGAIAHKIGKTTLGIKTTIEQLKVEGIGSKGILYIDIGGQIIVSKEVSLGMLISNINQAKFDTNVLSQPTTKIQVGINYHPHSKLLLLAQIEKDIINPATLKMGFEYLISKNVTVRTGVIPSPTVAYAGLGLIWQKINLDFVGSYAQSIGWSGGLSIGVPITSSNEE